MWPACAHACVTFFFIAVSTSVHAPSRLPLHKDHNVLVWLGASAGGSPYGSGHAARVGPRVARSVSPLDSEAPWLAPWPFSNFGYVFSFQDYT